MKRLKNITTYLQQGVLPWGDDNEETANSTTVNKQHTTITSNTLKPVCGATPKPVQAAPVEVDEEIQMITKHLNETLPPTAAKRKAQDIKELKEQMKTGVCHFIYVKASGETREAYGTRNNEVMDPDNLKEEKKTRHIRKAQNTFPYFDLEKKAWRCFNPEDFLELDRNYAI